MSRVRTRFAPSPTGPLHVGNVRVALLNWLFARRHGGDFVLRIEDTDPERNVKGAEEAILQDLRWLGLDWDEGPGGEGAAELGPSGPYRQSERTSIYDAALARLIQEGAAYPCFCAPEALESARQAAIERGETPRYPGTCRPADASSARPPVAAAEVAVRFRVPDEGEIVVEDAVRGEVRFEAAGLGDFIVRRSDGLPTYNFAVVVDDGWMGISHVIRGVGHLSNTPRQLLLYHALGLAAPIFAHVSTVLGPDGRKLSKRHGATAIAEFREEGYHPGALLNYLSLLSWSSPSGDEFLPRDRLIEEVSLERLKSSDATFDPGKLRWLSAKHVAAMPLADLVEEVRPHVKAAGIELADDRLAVAIEAIRSHLSRFSEAPEHLQPFLSGGRESAAGTGREGVGVAGAREGGGEPVLHAAHGRLADLPEWSEESIAAAIGRVGSDLGVRGRELYRPLRFALTGEEHGPPIAAVMAVKGRDAVLARLELALAGRFDAPREAT